tara:strand:+ start:476 stop:826 length:351 start_codon:yes stop_codon:yes gene_type:complete
MISLILIGCERINNDKQSVEFISPSEDLIINNQESFIESYKKLEIASDKYHNFISKYDSLNYENNSSRSIYIALLKDLIDSYMATENILKNMQHSKDNLKSNWDLLSQLIDKTFNK